MGDGDDDAERSHALHTIRCHSLVRVINPNDRHCLARAVNIGLKFRECGSQRTAEEFIVYCMEQDVHGGQAEQLLLDAGISPAKARYEIADAERIQSVLIERYGKDEVRIVIFAQEAQNRIVWKGWRGRTARFNLCLYLERSHFSFIGEPKQLLKVRTFFWMHIIIIACLTHLPSMHFLYYSFMVSASTAKRLLVCEFSIREDAMQRAVSVTVSAMDIHVQRRRVKIESSARIADLCSPIKIALIFIVKHKDIQQMATGENSADASRFANRDFFVNAVIMLSTLEDGSMNAAAVEMAQTVEMRRHDMISVNGAVALMHGISHVLSSLSVWIG